MDQAEIPALLARLASDEDAVRKMAVFKLQSSINDPSFADVFIASGGLMNLRRLIMGTGGNTLAYSLQCLARLLEVDMGWHIFEGPQANDLVERVVELVVTNPLVNILRGAMSILVALVGHSQSASRGAPAVGGGAGGNVHVAGTFGLHALKPAVAVHPQFFDLVIQQLQSADHALCASALMLINALIRDAISGDGPPGEAGAHDASGAGITPLPKGGVVSLEDWPKFIKRLQDLGLIKAVYTMMQSSSLQDLAHPLLEFQSLTKTLLRKWRNVRVDTEHPDHRRGLKSLHLASAPPAKPLVGESLLGSIANGASPNGKDKRHNPEKWRRLGFETESPAQDFDVAGFLGMMDLTDYVRKNEDGYQKLLLEQSTRPLHERCPIARASLAVTMVLYEHFDVDRTEPEDAAKGYQGIDGTRNLDRLFRPLLLQWSRLHTVGLHAFFRIWKSTGAADAADFEKVVALVRILVGRVVGQAARTKDVLEVEEELQEFDVNRLRELQMDLLETSFDDQWGQHLHQVRDELRQEALQFVREQRIRCLLQGSWFAKPVPARDLVPAVVAAASAPDEPSSSAASSTAAASTVKRRLYTPKPWRYVKLSPNRRYLHYGDYEKRPDLDPTLDSLPSKIDLSTISSVVSNVSATSAAADPATALTEEDDSGSVESAATLRITTTPPPEKQSTSSSSSATNLAPAAFPAPPGKDATKITIFSYTAASATDSQQQQQQSSSPKEEPLLALYPHTRALASEWLDGLLMLLNQQPMTAETARLVQIVREYGLRIRLLNVRLETAYAGPPPGAGVVPSRDGLDEDYYYEI